MNKNAIWGIIGLMSLALLGIIVMQAYWINQSIQVTEEQFDKSVFSALNNVAAKLEVAEVYATTSNLARPTFHSLPSDVRQELFSSVESNNSISVEFSFYGDLPLDSFLMIEQDVFYEQHDEENCMCARCKITRIEEGMEAYFNQFRTAFAKRSVCTKPIRQRIDPENFDNILTTELENHGINIPYEYGIYSDRLKEFVITNISNTKKDKNRNNNKNNVTYAQASSLSLLNTDYRVRLFPSDIHLPGYLMLTFPGKKGYMWRSVMPTLLGSIIFSGIILFCFAYTIQVIFEQKKLSEIKNDFINNMTHEFKTPIATISLAADSITSPRIAANADKVKRFAGIIKQENKRMNNQVEKVLQMAILDKQEFKLNIKQVNVHEIIENAIATLSLQVEKREGSITSELNANNFVLKADETHITNAILNLLDNANKYSPENPEISVYTRNTSKGIQITVRDRGLGMNKETKKRIFEKFYRVHTGNLHDIKGFGLGLAYVKAIMDAHKGTISVKSELNKGSRFTLFFPFEPNKN